MNAVQNDAKPAGPKKRKQTKRKKGRPATKTSAREIARRERIQDILALRVQGWSLQAIGDAQAPRISAQRVHQIIFEHLRDTPSTDTETVRKLELLRLDEMQIKLFESAMKGGLLEIDRVLAIMDRRARYLGLDAPVRTDDSNEQSQAKASLLEKLTKMGERMAQAPVIDAIALPAPQTPEKSDDP